MRIQRAISTQHNVCVLPTNQGMLSGIETANGARRRQTVAQTAINAVRCGMKERNSRYMRIHDERYTPF